MRYRKLIGENNEPSMGRGREDFYIDADAVGQAVLTRLRLYKGEWWENQLLGLPLWQSMLGVSGTRKGIIDQLIQNCIRLTSGVNKIVEVRSQFNSATRNYEFYSTIKTNYGDITIVSQGEIQR